jgi:hypothetical protein
MVDFGHARTYGHPWRRWPSATTWLARVVAEPHLCCVVNWLHRLLAIQPYSMQKIIKKLYKYMYLTTQHYNDYTRLISWLRHCRDACLQLLCLFLFSMIVLVHFFSKIMGRKCTCISSLRDGKIKLPLQITCGTGNFHLFYFIFAKNNHRSCLDARLGLCQALTLTFSRSHSLLFCLRSWSIVNWNGLCKCSDVPHIWGQEPAIWLTLCGQALPSPGPWSIFGQGWG